MTIEQAIREDLRGFDVRSSLIVRNCLKIGLNADDNLNFNDTKTEKKIAIVVVTILSQFTTMTAISEAGLSKSFDPEQVKDRIRILCKKNGLDYSDYIQQPKVTRINYYGR